MKGIKREFSVARTPQQNRVVERKNRTLIDAARTMLADSKLLTTFWAEVINNACYVQNRVLVIKPHNKTPYELFLGKIRIETVPGKDYILLPLRTQDPPFSSSLKDFFLRTQKGSSSTEGSKLDRSYAGRASTIQVTRSLDLALWYISMDVKSAISLWLISWQCKKQNVVANSTTKAEYIAASNCCGQIQALVDKKKVIITKISIRKDLQLADENGTECLPNATIFAEIERIGYENLTQKLTFYKAFFSPQWEFLIHTILQCLSVMTTAWNEFSSTMVSAIICLATN
ncbi:putative ribonuclease H-like domain-containing protein [Tanacetum coccineum]